MKEIAKGWQDFWAEFFRIKHRHSIKGIREWEKKLVTHIIEVLDLKKGSRILDLGCGGGDQALEFARRDMSVVGVDIAKVLVDYGNEAARRENLSVKLIQGDMKDVKFQDEFDACIIISSFGFFDDDGNIKVLQVIEKALKHGGKFYVRVLNPFKYVSIKVKEGWKGWAEVDNGYVLMDSNYNPLTGEATDTFFYITPNGELIKFNPKDESVSVTWRLYTLPEIIKLIKAAALVFKAAYGSMELPPEEYKISSKEMIVVGEKS